MTRPERTITVTARAEWDMTVGEVWPDGDEPDEITADAVAELIRRCPSFERWVDEWNMLDGWSVTIRTRNPHHQPDTPLIVEHAPDVWVIAEVTWR